MQGASLQSYDFTITAGQTMPLLASGNYFLIKSSTGALDVRGEFGQAKAMIAGQGLSGRDFTKLELKNNSAGTITGVILIEDGAENGNGFFDLNLILSGSLIVRPEAANGSYATGAALAANTADTIFLPSANTNGAIVQYASALQCDGVNFGMPTFLYKSSAPANCFDGTAIAMGNRLFGAAGAGSGAGCELQAPAYIPAGNGFYFITSYGSGVTANNGRSARYKLL